MELRLSNLAKTGDTFPMVLWCGIVCCAALAVGVTVRKKALAK